MSRIRISKGRFIGDGEPVFIVAEAGVNHNGKLDLAYKLVDAAVEAGCDAVKFQTFEAERMITGNAPMAAYQKRNIGKPCSQLEMIKELELSYSDFAALKKYCDKKRIIFFSTPFDDRSVCLLDRLKVSCFKVSSGDLDNLPLLELISEKGKPVILSTGMSTVPEIKDAVSLFNSRKKNNICLMQCTSNYPVDPINVNLRVMLTLRRLFKVPVGFSDHTEGIEISLAAVALGACIIEKHLTLDKRMEGPDHKASLSPEEFNSLVRGIRKIEKALGEGVKRVSECELNTRLIARKSVVADRDISRGEVIIPKMLAIKRPSGGLPPKFFSCIVGKKSKRNISRDEFIRKEDI